MTDKQKQKHQESGFSEFTLKMITSYNSKTPTNQTTISSKTDKNQHQLDTILQIRN